MISRRDFVKGGVALVSIGTSADSLLKGAVAFARENPADVADTGKILVLVQLAGGNDGLNTLVPIGDAKYRDYRRQLGVAEEQVLPLQDGLALHPALSGLKGLWDAGKLAVVQGVGYPNQDYSHFKSMAIWQSGDPNLALRDGWLGRTLEKLESQQHDPFLGFNVGASTPPEMRTDAIAVPSVQDPETYGFQVRGQVVEGDPRTATLMKLYEQYPTASPYGALLETTVDSAVSSASLLKQAGAVYRPAVAYPQTPFAAGLSVLAQAIVGKVGMRVGHISLPGFDTHNRQSVEHPALLKQLDEGLAAFSADLAAQGMAGDVLVLTWSEFGRRVQENANDGTDHGSASVLFALGEGVQKGIYGEAPSLAQLIDKGNLAYTVDFRQVYATVIERWLGTPADALLGQRWDQLGFVPA